VHDVDPRSDYSSTGGTPCWLELAGGSIYAVLHEPEDQSRDTAVLMLPAFGWDEACSYRARQQWACASAEAGFPTVRFDLPGSEDGLGSPLDPGRYSSWIHAVIELASWLRRTSGAKRVVAVGLGLGGLIAAEAIRAGAVIDDLVLWAVPARGRAYIRELKMYANAMAPETGEPERSDGAFAIGGYLVSKETGDAIKAASGVLESAEGRRILLIERDAHGIDDELRAQLVEGGGEVSVLSSEGEYAAMMTFPDVSQAPRKTIAGAVEWMSQGSVLKPGTQSLARSPEAVQEISFAYEGQVIRERQVRFDTDGGPLFGILSEPLVTEPGRVCLISQNSGALRRTGQCRMWTDMCRRWASRGVPALRVDLNGIGDSSGRFVSNEDRQRDDETRTIAYRLAIADELERESVANEFVSIGLCLGAYWELKAAVRDPRLRGTVLLNQTAFDSTDEQKRERSRRWALSPLRYAFRPLPGQPRLWHPETMKNVVRGVFLTVRGAFSAAERSQVAPAVSQFDSLSATGTRVLMLFSEPELLYRQMQNNGLVKMLPRWPRIELEELPTKDHDLRPLQIQELVNERADRFISEIVSQS
jgi:pimeloyl-ACP methyl ester carboxylesterase